MCQSVIQWRHLAVLLRVAPTQLVDPVEVVRGNDETVELPQVAVLSVLLVLHAVVMHCGLAPHTPGGEGHTHRLAHC